MKRFDTIWARRLNLFALFLLLVMSAAPSAAQQTLGVYVANQGGCVRASVPSPGNYVDQPCKWTDCTPSVAGWSAKNGRATPKTADLEPADRATPQMAAFGGYLFAGPRTHGRPRFPKKAWQDALDAAEIEDFRFHDLRHTAASYLAMSGATLPELAGFYRRHGFDADVGGVTLMRSAHAGGGRAATEGVT